MEYGNLNFDVIKQTERDEVLKELKNRKNPDNDGESSENKILAFEHP
jgi:hypothetical protein